MKRLLAFALTLTMVLCCTTSLAASDETLYSRVLTLLEDGDETINYDGLGLCVTMDGADYPEGLVTANLDAATGLIRIENGENYALWEQVPQTDLVTSVMVLCGRWNKLAEDMTDSFQIIFSVPNGNEAESITFTTAEDALDFVQYIYQQSAQQ